MIAGKRKLDRMMRSKLGVDGIKLNVVRVQTCYKLGVSCIQQGNSG